MTMEMSFILGEYLSLSTYMLLLNSPFHLICQNKRNEIYLSTISDPRNWILSGIYIHTHIYIYTHTHTHTLEYTSDFKNGTTGLKLHFSCGSLQKRKNKSLDKKYKAI